MRVIPWASNNGITCYCKIIELALSVQRSFRLSAFSGTLLRLNISGLRARSSGTSSGAAGEHHPCAKVCFVQLLSLPIITTSDGVDRNSSARSTLHVQCRVPQWCEKLTDRLYLIWIMSQSHCDRLAVSQNDRSMLSAVSHWVPQWAVFLSVSCGVQGLTSPITLFYFKHIFGWGSLHLPHSQESYGLKSTMKFYNHVDSQKSK